MCEDDVPLGDHLPLTAFRGAWQVGDEALLIVVGADLDHALVKEDAHGFASQCEAKASGEAPCAYKFDIYMQGVLAAVGAFTLRVVSHDLAPVAAGGDSCLAGADDAYVTFMAFPQVEEPVEDGHAGVMAGVLMGNEGIKCRNGICIAAFVTIDADKVQEYGEALGRVEGAVSAPRTEPGNELIAHVAQECVRCFMDEVNIRFAEVAIDVHHGHGAVGVDAASARVALPGHWPGAGALNDLAMYQGITAARAKASHHVSGEGGEVGLVHRLSLG